MSGNHKMGGINATLRDRVADEMALFTRALDAAIAKSTPESLDSLRESGDQLMRAVGRVLIEIGRLRGLAQS